MTEDRDEKIINEHNAENQEEVAETVDELVKEKATNEFIARENTAQVQIFVQTANFGNKSDLKLVKDLINLDTGKDKKYKLFEMEDCAEFFSTCKHKEYIALAIMLSVFEIIPIGDYTNLRDILIENLPSVLQTDKEEKNACNQQANPYISLNTILSIIGGKIFITNDGQRCIGYGEGFEKILNNIWTQFPNLRKPMISWLLRTNEVFEYKTSFEVYQVVGAFIRIILEDFQYAERQVFDRLYSDPNNLGLIARLAQELMRDKRFNTDILNMVLRWTESESDWLWKSALLVCMHTYGTAIDMQLHKAMICAVRKRMFVLKNSDLRFIVLFAGNAKNVRIIIADVFYNLCKSSSMWGKENLAKIYLRMIRYGYYQVNRSKIDLPFVTCDSKKQMDNLHVVLKFIMEQYDLYRQLCWILQAYLEEISNYDVSHEILNYITAFFYVLTRDKYDFQRDILLFLSELKGNTAKKIYDKLIKIYGNIGGKMYE